MVFSITATLEGLDEILRKYEEAGEALVRDLHDIQMEEMERAVATARNLAPVATGFLQSQIGIQDVGETWIEGGVVGVRYCRFVEFGTRYTNAQPYWIAPAWEAFFRMRQRMRETLRRLLKGG